MIVVIGGGWAGCAAAVELARSGRDVALHDAAPVLGGRARTVVRDDLPLDNGEHLLLGAYAETLRLAAIVHRDDEPSPWLTAPLAIRPFSPQQRNGLSLRARRLPAPLGLLVGLLGADGLTWSERIATIRWFARLRASGFRCAAGATVEDIVAPLPVRARDGLWTPLCIAALNTPPAEASAQVFLNVLREAFAGAANAAQAVRPRDGLAASFPDAAARWLRERGHDRKRVVGRCARMDHERLVCRTGCANVRTKTLALPAEVAGEPEIIEPRLAHGDDFRIAAALDQHRFGRLIDVLIVRMHADACIEIGMRVRDRVHDRPVVHLDGDA